MSRLAMTIFSGAVLSLAAVTASAREDHPDTVGSQPQSSEGATYVSLWGTGVELGSYHNLSAGCETMVHGFGRNAFWGRWSMPTQAVALEVVQTPEGADLVFSCRDGSTCVLERDQGERTLAVHRVTFNTVDRATRFAGQMSSVAERCAARQASEPNAPGSDEAGRSGL